MGRKNTYTRQEKKSSHHKLTVHFIAHSMSLFTNTIQQIYRILQKIREWRL